MEILIKASQLILSLSILVVLHELGHFIPAKLFKTRIEKFYLFFDPWFSLVKKKVGDTEYGIGWLPLGGYVKISGMIDESMDKEQMKKDPEPWEFRAKPAWQRLIIMLGGVTVNLLLGIFIYSMVLFSWGDTYIPIENVDGVDCSEFAESLGFNDGDNIISIDGERVEKFSDIGVNMILRDDPFNVVVERNGNLIDVNIGSSLIGKWVENGKEKLFIERIPVVVSSIFKNSNADNSDLKIDDRILSVNGISCDYFSAFRIELEKNKGDPVELIVNRGNENIPIVVDVTLNADIGFELKNYKSTKHYSFLSSLPAGYNLAIKKLGEYINQFSLIFNSDNNLGGELGGFGAIGSMFAPQWNWHAFWYLTAFLSLMLAFMNLLPIPALDGGHVMFLLYEIIIGKPAPDKVMEYAQMVGMVLLLSLLVFANGNDILRLF